MKVDLVEKTDYLVTLIDRSGSARTRALAAAFLLGLAAFGFMVAQGALESAATAAAPEIRALLAGLRVLAVLGMIGSGLTALVPLAVADLLGRIEREAVPVRYAMIAEGVEIDLPAGDAR